MKRKSVMSLALCLGLFMVAGMASAAPVTSEYRKGVLAPNASFSLDFWANNVGITVVTVVGDGNGDIDCRLATPSGNMNETSAVDGCTFSVSPLTLAFYDLWVVNKGSLPTNFTLILS